MLHNLPTAYDVRCLLPLRGSYKEFIDIPRRN